MQMSDLRAARDSVPDDIFGVVAPDDPEPLALVHKGFPKGLILISKADLKFLRRLAGKEIMIVNDSTRAFEFTLLQLKR